MRGIRELFPTGGVRPRLGSKYVSYPGGFRAHGLDVKTRGGVPLRASGRCDRVQGRFWAGAEASTGRAGSVGGLKGRTGVAGPGAGARRYDPRARTNPAQEDDGARPRPERRSASMPARSPGDPVRDADGRPGHLPEGLWPGVTVRPGGDVRTGKGVGWRPDEDSGPRPTFREEGRRGQE